jgi:serine/threonine-protein kinase
MLFPAPSPPQDLSATPDVRGLTLTEALEVLRAGGLEVGATDSIRHPSAAQGVVLGQSPLPGQLTEPGTEVALTYSMGPELREIPDVVRLRAERARTVLEATGFLVTLDSVESSEFKGTVVAVEPEPGAELPLPAEVVLAVSLGPPMVPMPDLLGLPEEEALVKLDSLGLLVPEVETRFRFGLDQGTVIEQEPAPEEMVEQGSAVRIVVAREAGDSRNNRPPTP